MKTPLVLILAILFGFINNATAVESKIAKNKSADKWHCSPLSSTKDSNMQKLEEEADSAIKQLPIVLRPTQRKHKRIVYKDGRYSVCIKIFVALD